MRRVSEGLIGKVTVKASLALNSAKHADGRVAPHGAREGLLCR